LFSSALHTRAAQKALEHPDGGEPSTLIERLSAIAGLTKRAQREMRKFIFEWGPDGVGDGLVAALTQHVSTLDECRGLVVDVRGPATQLPLSTVTQTQLYGIGREALANIARHSQAAAADVRVSVNANVVTMEISDDGCGFDPAVPHPGHYGLQSMQSRAQEIAATLYIGSNPGDGTVIRVQVAAETEREPVVA
jgi:signal transduction histidine kinase